MKTHTYKKIYKNCGFKYEDIALMYKINMCPPFSNMKTVGEFKLDLLIIFMNPPAATFFMKL